jgi:hypothetical protein
MHFFIYFLLLLPKHVGAIVKSKRNIQLSAFVGLSLYILCTFLCLPTMCHLAQAVKGHRMLMVLSGYLKVISVLLPPQV